MVEVEIGYKLVLRASPVESARAWVTNERVLTVLETPVTVAVEYAPYSVMPELFETVGLEFS